MKTKELINQLQKLDPEGNTHVMLSTGALERIELKRSWYDGKLEYIDEEQDTYIITMEGDKIVLYAIDYEGWIYYHDGDYSNIVLDLRYVNDTNKRMEFT